MLSIASSKKTGSQIPFHSSSSILHGTLPCDQRAAESFRKEFSVDPDPMGFGAMSPSRSWEVSLSTGAGAKAPRYGGRHLVVVVEVVVVVVVVAVVVVVVALHAVKNPRQRRKPMIIMARSD